MEGKLLDIAFVGNIAFVGITALVAYHGLTFRDEKGDTEWGHLLFGCIAMVFCLRVLFVDIFGVTLF